MPCDKKEEGPRKLLAMAIPGIVFGDMIGGGNGPNMTYMAIGGLISMIFLPRLGYCFCPYVTPMLGFGAVYVGMRLGKFALMSSAAGGMGGAAALIMLQGKKIPRHVFYGEEARSVRRAERRGEHIMLTKESKPYPGQSYPGRHHHWTHLDYYY